MRRLLFPIKNLNTVAPMLKPLGVYVNKHNGERYSALMTLGQYNAIRPALMKARVPHTLAYDYSMHTNTTGSYGRRPKKIAKRKRV